MQLLVVIATVAGNGVKLKQQGTFLRQKFNVAALWADEHGVSATDTVRQESKSGWPVIGQLGVAAEARDRQLIFNRPNSLLRGLVAGWLGFHKAPQAAWATIS
jgi:hypothetical protein